MQFFVVLCILTKLYYNSRIKFSLVLATLIAICASIELHMIWQQDFSTSYKNPQDEYWSKFYYKPFTRLYGYFIGVWLGCEYFTFKHIAASKSMFGSAFNSIRDNKSQTFYLMIFGFLIQFILVQFHYWVNNN